MYVNAASHSDDDAPYNGASQRTLIPLILGWVRQKVECLKLATDRPQVSRQRRQFVIYDLLYFLLTWHLWLVVSVGKLK